MTKNRVNWTISPDVQILIKDAQRETRKERGKEVSQSRIVERAIRETYGDREKYLRDKIKKHLIIVNQFQEQLEIYKNRERGRTE